MILNYWNCQWRSARFDQDTGSGRVRWLSGRPEKNLGWAFKRGGAWYALWSDGATLLFQAGEIRLPVVDSYLVSNVRTGGFRRFSVTCRGEHVLSVDYRAIDRDSDPTFGVSDLELEDFLFYVARVWADGSWRASLIKSWDSTLASSSVKQPV